MSVDPKKVAAFEADMQKILDKYKLKLVVCPLFIDRLGNKHGITIGAEFSAELQVQDIKDGTN